MANFRRIIFLLLTIFPILSGSNPMLTGLLGAGGACYPLSASWTPRFANLGGYWKLDETAATAGANNDFTDSSGNNLFGEQATGGLTYAATGKMQNAIGMDGSNDGVIFGNVLNMGSANFSVSAWVKTTSNVVGINRNGIVYKKTTAAIADAGYRLSLPNGQLSFRIGNGTSGLEVNSVRTGLNDDKWHFVVGVRDSGFIRIYIDGALDSSLAETIGNIDTTTVLAIGGLATTATAITFQPYLGQIDEVAIWQRALTREEIKTIYDQQSCGQN